MRFAAVALLLSPLHLTAQHGQDRLGNPFNTAADAEAGRLLYRANCAVCHGLDGSGGRGTDLTRGVFRHGSTDEALFRTIVRGVPGTEMPPVSIEGRQTWQLIAFIRSLSFGRGTGKATGDPARGRSLFESNGCHRCHRIGDRGSRTGPDLTTIGESSTLAHLETSLLRPGDGVKPEHWTIHAVTSAGRRISGRRLNEDTFTAQLIDADERLLSIRKADLREYRVDTGSPMPPFAGSKQQLDDLVAYLASLK